jgi:hypothetical protein
LKASSIILFLLALLEREGDSEEEEEEEEEEQEEEEGIKNAGCLYLFIFMVLYKEKIKKVNE